MKKIRVGPLTRANNVLSVDITVENKRVVDAQCSGVFFRGFEIILRGRDPRDAPYITERICGICSSAHATAAAFALEDAAGVRPPRNGNLLRNLILGADFLQNHIRNLYLFELPDYVKGPDLGPFTPGLNTDYRLSAKATETMIQHYFEAIRASRLAHEMVTILGGKVPHTHGILAGGSTVPPTADVLMDFRFKLRRVGRFIKDMLIPDLLTLSEVYSDYYEIGARPTKLLACGLFPEVPNESTTGGWHFPSGAVVDGQLEPFDDQVITEQVGRSWYAADGGGEGGADQGPGTHPAAGDTVPDRRKPDAYSWIKAPRYRGEAMEGGALARLWISGDYRQGPSTMDRAMARAMEAELIAVLMQEWIDQLEPGAPIFNSFEVPVEAEGVGLTGAMRGPLGHWVRIENRRIAHYEIITPTAWNLSSHDDQGRLGPVEEALIGTPIENEKEPIEVGRVVRSFDPCSSCATHVLVAGSRARKVVIL